MTTLYEGAFAKLNLTLDVTGKREDGYHNISSVMQTIAIRDDVEIDLDTGKPWKLVCTTEGVPCDERNLAWKAAEAFFETYREEHKGETPDGIEIRIKKRIPMEAGLGGGSADAAAVLRALNRNYGEPFSIYALAEIGASVGSDVPFCVVMGTALVEGRGEKIRKLPGLPECTFVVCKPEFSVSTPELYKKIDEVAIPSHPNNQIMESALMQGDLDKVCDQVLNVFDPVVTQDHLELNYIKSIMTSYGAKMCQMTGSGSAVFAIMPSAEYGIIVCDMLREKYPNIYLCTAVG